MYDFVDELLQEDNCNKYLIFYCVLFECKYYYNLWECGIC